MSSSPSIKRDSLTEQTTQPVRPTQPVKPNSTAAANPTCKMSVPANDWNSRLKDFISGLAGLAPEIGEIVKFILQTYWPTSYDDIWKLMENAMTDLVHKIVDAAILKQELAKRESELKALQASMNQYVAAQAHEKGSLMSAMLEKSKTLFEELDGSEDDVHLPPFTITHAYQHLALLKERVLFGKEMYDHDDTPLWKEELDDYLQKYRDYFVRKNKKWNQWRNEQINVHYYTKRPSFLSPVDSYCDITDQLTEKKWQYFATLQDDPHVLEPGVQMLKHRVLSEIVAQMVKSVYIAVFELGRFIPGHENDPPVADKSLGILSLGPFSVASADDKHDWSDFQSFKGSLSNDKPGTITQVDVRAYNSIDGSQIYYKGHKGTFVGNSKGGELHKFPVADKAVVNYVHMGFAQGLLAEVQYKASDKTDSGKLGNKSGWHIRYTVNLDTSVILDANFILRAINMQEGMGPSKTTGVANVLLTYHHNSLI